MDSEICMDGGYIWIWTERPWFAVTLNEIDITTEKAGMNRNLAKNDGTGEGQQQQLTGLDWTGRYVKFRIQYLTNFPFGLILLIDPHESAGMAQLV
jgi:hypothetical protein